ncbi:MAG: TlyA family RNA methyltransferase [Clostridiales bacterium]|jgi:23S rRNA (cytidine1920-2'-O)/16S rRNA (cytidine1409-2'-O)-methyltransferase|nr:TlyA family RNA methyltransferase [Clostridiales bacterium]
MPLLLPLPYWRNVLVRKRIDQLLFERGYFESREKAKASVMSGIVFVDDMRIIKPGTQVSEDVKIDIRGNTISYVSRGGLKLEKAILDFNLSLNGVVAADIGASTGGFTDCMLQNGASKVYAVDVGYGQLAWKLRQDDRVVVMERTNIRHVTPDMIGEMLDFVSIDVSFISLKLVLPVVRNLVKPTCKVVALVKPQFEAGREKVGKKGVVRDPNVHLEVLEEFTKNAIDSGFSVNQLTYSPIKGPEGNIEYLACLTLQTAKQDNISNYESIDLSKVVEESHNVL